METEESGKKVVVIGGTGLIGSQVVAMLNKDGYNAVAAAPNTGVNTITGEGLAEVLEGAAVVIDVSNSPSFDDEPAMNFFKTSTGNLLRYEAEAGVRHHIVLSVVGADRMTDVGYYRAKVAQEELVKGSSIPYSFIHATQFFQFTKGIADSATDGETVRLPPILIQPIAAEEVAKAVAEAAEGSPLNSTREVAGPDVLKIEDFVRKGLEANNDNRKVVTVPDARFFGAQLSERDLLPSSTARLSDLRFDDWLKTQESAFARPSIKQAAAANE